MVRKSSCSTLGINTLIPEAVGHHALPLRASLFTTFLCILFGTNMVAIKISLTELGVFTNAAMLYQTLVTPAFGFVAWNTIIRKLGATALHSFVFIMPVSGVFLGVTLLGEPVTANLIYAIVLVVTGLIVVNKVSRSRLPR